MVMSFAGLVTKNDSAGEDQHAEIYPTGQQLQELQVWE
jgi:hypothetical protein